MKWCLWICLLTAGSLSAEVVQVQMTWNRLQCETTCITVLKNTLNKYPPVVSYKIDGPKGVAYLQWNPESQFELATIKRVYQSVGFGFGIGDVIITVRGVIEKKGKDFILRSIGDNSRFRLIGSANPSKTSFSSTGSYLSYPLSAELRKQLEEGVSQKFVTEITGGLYNTQFDYPMIMIKDLSFPNKL